MLFSYSPGNNVWSAQENHLLTSDLDCPITPRPDVITPARYARHPFLIGQSDPLFSIDNKKLMIGQDVIGVCVGKWPPRHIQHFVGIQGLTALLMESDGIF